jgi:hypothetical protein
VKARAVLVDARDAVAVTLIPPTASVAVINALPDFFDAVITAE